MIRVLIVDDEVRLLRSLASHLESLPDGFDVLTARDRMTALKILSGCPVDLLLTEVRRPRLDGVGLVCRALERHVELKVIIMAAPGGEDFRDVARWPGALRFIERPLDLEDLRRALLEAAREPGGGQARAGGLSAFDFTRLVAVSGKSKAARVACGKEKGMLCLDGGRLVHASTDVLDGEAAFLEMAGWEAGGVKEIPAGNRSKPPANVAAQVSRLVAEAARLRENARRTKAEEADRSPAESTGTPALSGGDRMPAVDGTFLSSGAAESASTCVSWGDDHTVVAEGVQMAVKDLLEELSSASGFKGAAVFTPRGEMIEFLTADGRLDVRTTGMFANNALLNAQKATEQMGLGRGNLIQIRAPQAVVIMRCLNQATNFAVTAAGRAHFHTVVVMEPGGNVGMAIIILDEVVGKMAQRLNPGVTPGAARTGG